MPHISIITPCFNEAENVKPLHESIRSILLGLPHYTYEHIFIDNCSNDGTDQILKQIAGQDKKVKLIFNVRNFGHIRSPTYALLQCSGDAAIMMASDFQDPPELIPQLIKKWEEGHKVVLGVRTATEEFWPMSAVRSSYYRLIGKISEIKLISNYTGYGLYDRQLIEIIRKIDDPYPYFRGLISDIGFTPCMLPFKQKMRRRGSTKNNLYTLYDMAMLGITNHSKVPLRIATILGFGMSVFGFLLAIGYLVAKLCFWYFFSAGTAPILIGLFLFSSVQLFFIGIMGEYIGSIHTQILKRPLVIEKERINFEQPSSLSLIGKSS